MWASSSASSSSQRRLRVRCSRTSPSMWDMSTTGAPNPACCVACASARGARKPRLWANVSAAYSCSARSGSLASQRWLSSTRSTANGTGPACTRHTWDDVAPRRRVSCRSWARCCRASASHVSAVAPKVMVGNGPVFPRATHGAGAVQGGRPDRCAPRRERCPVRRAGHRGCRPPSSTGSLARPADPS